MTREIPPFGLELVVSAMIAGKRELPSRNGLPEGRFRLLRGRRESEEHQEETDEEFAAHEREPREAVAV